jgi:hypothetical protein
MPPERPQPAGCVPSKPLITRILVEQQRPPEGIRGSAFQGARSIGARGRGGFHRCNRHGCNLNAAWSAPTVETSPAVCAVAEPTPASPMDAHRHPARRTSDRGVRLRFLHLPRRRGRSQGLLLEDRGVVRQPSAASVLGRHLSTARHRDQRL